jgi:hypothetical protein
MWFRGWFNFIWQSKIIGNLRHLLGFWGSAK